MFMMWKIWFMVDVVIVEDHHFDEDHME